MNCPYCGGKMQDGCISGNEQVLWVPRGENVMGIFRWSKSRNSIVLARDFLFRAKVRAHLCTNCEKIVIDAKNTRTD